MDTQKIEDSLKETLARDNNREYYHGEYHPSQVTGCPLKVVLNRMTNHDTVLNSWLFQGSAVHYYLQEKGLMDEALHEAGYHLLDTEYEVTNYKKVDEGIWITGTCDIVCHDGDGLTIFDIKYSSLPAESGHPRLYKYFSQVNTYAYMFGADEYGLMMINSKSQELLDNIAILDGEPNEENWELVKAKTRQIHTSLDDLGYTAGETWMPENLKSKDADFWEEVIDYFSKDQMPAYDGECNYCPHKEYCPIKTGKLNSGLGSFAGGAD